MHLLGPQLLLSYAISVTCFPYFEATSPLLSPTALFKFYGYLWSSAIAVSQHGQGCSCVPHEFPVKFLNLLMQYSTWLLKNSLSIALMSVPFCTVIAERVSLQLISILCSVNIRFSRYLSNIVTHGLTSVADDLAQRHDLYAIYFFPRCMRIPRKSRQWQIHTGRNGRFTILMEDTNTWVGNLHELWIFWKGDWVKTLISNIDIVRHTKEVKSLASAT